MLARPPRFAEIWFARPVVSARALAWHLVYAADNEKYLLQARNAWR